MRKILLFVAVAALFATACSTPQGRWNRQQKRELRHALHEYRNLVYLQNMTDAEFILFSDDVAGLLEDSYPSYVEFVEMPGVNDTIEEVIVTTIVSDLQANHHNMRHFFPYEVLRNAGVLPADMKREHLVEFYNCLAQSVNKYFGSYEAFVYAALSSSLDDAMIVKFQQQCAAPYWTNVSVMGGEGAIAPAGIPVEATPTAASAS